MIYFNQLFEACAFPIEDATATVDDDVWDKYCMDIRGTTWDIVDGAFVQLKSPEFVAERNKAQSRISELMMNLNRTDYKSIKHSEGLISDEDWEPVGKERMAWRAEINELQSKYDL